MAGSSAVAITAYSVYTALGSTRGEATARASRGEVELTQLEAYPVEGWVGARDGLRTCAGRDDRAVWDGSESPRLLALAAATINPLRAHLDQALKRWGARVGLVVGTSTGGLESTEFAHRELRRRGALPEHWTFDSHHTFHGLTDRIALQAGITGPRWVCSSACASSGKALASAQRLIRAGALDAVLVVGVDTLCDTTLQGFAGLGLLSSAPARPFHRERAGLSIGEGSASFLLERQGSARWHLLGCGESCDAHHPTAPHPEGLGARVALQRALAEARISPADVGYVNAHGTGTRLNDQVEAGALAQELPEVPFSSCKGAIGHLLGASSTAELAISMGSVEAGVYPPNAVVPGGVGVEFPGVLEAPEAADRRPIICNSFAFGGSNVAVVVGQHGETTPPARAPDPVYVRAIALSSSRYPTLQHWLDKNPVDNPGPPAANLLPKRARGRASLHARRVVEISEQLLAGGNHASEVGLILGSSYGEMQLTLEILEMLALGRPISPLRFQACVHNAALGAVATALGNRGFQTALAAGADTCAVSLLEASAWLTTGGQDALVILADEQAPLPLVAKDYPALAIGLHLSRRGEGALAKLGPLEHHTSAALLNLEGLNPIEPGLPLIRALAEGTAGTVEIAGPRWTTTTEPCESH